MEQDEVKQEESSQIPQARADWRSMVEKLSYKAIVDNIPFLIFLSVLCILYISNSHRSLEIERELNKQHETLSEMRWKYLNAKSDLMREKTEYQVINNAKKLGLQPSLLPAYKISAIPHTNKK
jgi:cell division protein FtsL